MQDALEPTEPLGVITEIYARIAKGDVSSVKPLIAPDFVAIQAAALPFGGHWHGRDAFAAMGAAIYAAWPDFAVRPDRFLADADTVLVVTQVSGGAGTLDQPMIERWRVAAGQAIECQPFYFDAAAAAASAKQGD